jgi:hypothetical protein
MWGFRFSSPYRCYRYDECHIDGLGEWAAHLWPVLLEKIKTRDMDEVINFMYGYSPLVVAHLMALIQDRPLPSMGRNQALQDLHERPLFGRPTAHRHTEGGSRQVFG